MIFKNIGSAVKKAVIVIAASAVLLGAPAQTNSAFELKPQPRQSSYFSPDFEHREPWKDLALGTSPYTSAEWFLPIYRSTGFTRKGEKTLLPVVRLSDDPYHLKIASAVDSKLGLATSYSLRRSVPIDVKHSLGLGSRTEFNQDDMRLLDRKRVSSRTIYTEAFSSLHSGYRGVNADLTANCRYTEQQLNPGQTIVADYNLTLGDGRRAVSLAGGFDGDFINSTGFLRDELGIRVPYGPVTFNPRVGIKNIPVLPSKTHPVKYGACGFECPSLHNLNIQIGAEEQQIGRVPNGYVGLSLVI